MKMFIHSSFGVLDCVPMTLQAIEKSIPDAAKEQTEQVQGDQSPTPSDSLSQRGVVEGDECPF